MTYIYLSMVRKTYIKSQPSSNCENNYKIFLVGTKSCHLNIPRTLRGANSTWKPIPDVHISHTASGFSVYNISAHPYFQLVVPHRLSILQAFYGPTSLRNDRSLRAQLLRNESFWIVKIAGQITQCPGIKTSRLGIPVILQLHNIIF